MPDPLRPQRCEVRLEQRTGHLVSVVGLGSLRSRAMPRSGRPIRIGAGHGRAAVAPNFEMIMSATTTRARGD